MRQIESKLFSKNLKILHVSTTFAKWNVYWCVLTVEAGRQILRHLSLKWALIPFVLTGPCRTGAKSIWCFHNYQPDFVHNSAAALSLVQSQ